jgi:phosphate starvation-inducible protein PhoH
MPVKKRNLTKENVEDVSTYEIRAAAKTLATGKMTLNKVQIKVKCFNEKQKQLKQLIEDNQIIMVSGPSGVGKTFFTLMMALHLMKTEPVYKQLTLIKSVTVIKGEELGFLPGDKNEKILPYMRSFTGNLDKIFKSKITTMDLLESEVIQFQPIAYIRGVNIDNEICIIDETQNIDVDTFKAIVTRIGSNSKFIFLGDTEQIDRKNKKESCFKKMMDIFEDDEHVGVLRFTKEDDCVRNPIIPHILDVLESNGI